MTLMLDATAIEEVPLPTWCRVFDDIGYPEGLASGTLTHDAIVEHSSEGQPSELLLEALQTLLEIGTEQGLESMRQVAVAKQVDLGPLRGRPAERLRSSSGSRHGAIRTSGSSIRTSRCSRRRAGLLEWCKMQDLAEHLDVRGYVREVAADTHR